MPHGWTTATLGEIAEYINGRAFKPDEWEESGRPIIRIQNLTKSTNVVNYFSKPVKEKFIINDGELLISWSATLGAYIYKGKEAVLNQHIFKVIPYIDKMFLYYLVNYMLTILQNNVHGTGMQHITKGKFEATEIPLPPLAEQVRIVGRVEELFSRLDAGVRSLQTAQTQLEQYRQTTLKQAYTGKLTEKWRKSSAENQLSSNILLVKIEDYRKQNGIKKPRKLPILDTSELIQIPDNWLWVQINDVTSELQYGTSTKANYDETGLPVLRMGNIQDGKLDYTDLKYFDPSSPKVNEFLLTEGDILFNRTNSTELVGKTAIYHDSYPDSIFASYLIRVKTFKKFIIPEIISEFINSAIGKNYIAKVRSQQVGQANVNGTKLAAMPLPLIPYNEQEKILDILDTVNSNLVNIKNEIERSTKQADFLKQSILKKAFEGKLVPQDPRDEPASVLLDRIKAQRVKQRKLM